MVSSPFEVVGKPMASSFHGFANRSEAGQMLAEALSGYIGRSDILVLALPRGGVPVAYEVARKLSAPLDLWLVRKLGVPGREELALGALAEKNIRVLNDDIINLLHIDQSVIDDVIGREQAELGRRNREGVTGCTAKTDHPRISRVRRRSLSMTDLPRALPCVLQLFRFVRRMPHRSSRPCQWVPCLLVEKLSKKRMNLYACIRQNLFMALGNGISIFPRLRMRKCWHC